MVIKTDLTHKEVCEMDRRYTLKGRANFTPFYVKM